MVSQSWPAGLSLVSPHYSWFVISPVITNAMVLVSLFSHVVKAITQTVTKDSNKDDLTWLAHEGWVRCVTACLNSLGEKKVPDFVKSYCGLHNQLVWPNSDTSFEQNKSSLLAASAVLLRLSQLFVETFNRAVNYWHTPQLTKVKYTIF